VELLPFVFANNFTLLLLAAVVAVGMWGCGQRAALSKLLESTASVRTIVKLKRE
jgi:hypothetical protein